MSDSPIPSPPGFYRLLLGSGWTVVKVFSNMKPRRFFFAGDDRAFYKKDYDALGFVQWGGMVEFES